jgi:hypothetical protein
MARGERGVTKRGQIVEDPPKQNTGLLGAEGIIGPMENSNGHQVSKFAGDGFLNLGARQGIISRIRP